MLWPIRPLRALGAQKADHYISRTGLKMHSGAYVALRQHTGTGEGYQELRPPVCWKSPGCPDLDVYRSRFEPLSRALGPSGRREPLPRLQ